MKMMRSVFVSATVGVIVASGLAMAYEQQGQQQPTAAPPPGLAAAPAGGQAAAGARGTTEGAGSTIFGNYCEQCHGKIETAPSPAMMKKLTPEHIYEKLTTGSMVPMAKDLTDQQKRDIAEWVGGRKLGAGAVGDAKKMPNQCSTNGDVKSLTAMASWNGWSPGNDQTRFQDGAAAGISPEKISDLRLKWAFALPGADSVYGQPTIVDGKVYVSSDAGFIYSLDAKTGCVHWSYQAAAGVRSPVIIGPIKPGSSHYAAFFGDVRGNIYAVDANKGKLIWKSPIDPHQLSRITAGTQLYNGKLYVPVASLEEPESSSFNYLCCTFRGMVAALDSATGKEDWKTYTLPDVPTKHTTPDGKVYMGPAGVGVWGPITIDPKKNALYIGTGNTFSAPDVGRSDAVMAMDLDSGKILWIKQDEANDVWHTGCPQGPGPDGFPPKPVRPARAGAGYTAPTPPPTYWCADPEGPDWDISSGAMLANLPDGKRLLVVGQKSGLVWGHDPDHEGELKWRSRADLARGQIVFGGAMDKDTAYFAFRSGGVDAIDITTGKEKWYTLVADPVGEMATHKGFSAAISVSPGLVYAGGLDGVFHIFSTVDGKEVWTFNTVKDFDTVNGIKAHGGSIGSAGPTVANGMVYITSGYTGFQNGVPGNVLLAFSE